MRTPSQPSDKAVALNRFGLGATPDAADIAPRAWLAEQLRRYDPHPAALSALSDGREAVLAYRAERQQMRKDGASQPGEKADVKSARADLQAVYRQAVQARLACAVQTDTPFVERLVHFWSNHFCVSGEQPEVAALAGAFERDAIRPHVLGRFQDMLLAVERHPAMLIFLNQDKSIGPDSPAAVRAAQKSPERQRGLNENLGREIMELHSLGVRSGYSQQDVTEFARALTGWTVGGADSAAPIGFLFNPRQHEPGTRSILGRQYPQPGEAQAAAVLADLAHAPATANHIATKLARHFAGDAPPPAMVARLASVFRESGGDLPAIYLAIIDSPEAWSPAPLKFKTPWEWTVSALRGMGVGVPPALPVAAMQQQLGQPVWKPGSPAGWEDVAASWAAPDALMRRVEMAQRLAARMGGRIDARQIAPRLFPAVLHPDTAEQVEKAESPASALALLLASPDFLRR